MIIQPVCKDKLPITEKLETYMKKRKILKIILILLILEYIGKAVIYLIMKL